MAPNVINEPVDLTVTKEDADYAIQNPTTPFRRITIIQPGVLLWALLCDATVEKPIMLYIGSGIGLLVKTIPLSILRAQQGETELSAFDRLYNFLVVAPDEPVHFICEGRNFPTK